MFGRAAYQTPWILTDVDRLFYNGIACVKSRDDIAHDIIKYAKSHERKDRTTKALIRHIMGLYAGEKGARTWRRTLSEQSAKGLMPSDVIAAALNARNRSEMAA